LLAVKTDGPAPVLSCALKLPGQPKYFFYKGSELVLLVNGTGVNEGALLRFRVTADGFDFVDSVMLDQQNIQDARLFDSTLVVYPNLCTPIMSDATGTGTGTGTGTTGTGTATPPSSGGASAGAGASGDAASLPRPGGYSTSTGVAVTAVKWDAA